MCHGQTGLKVPRILWTPPCPDDRCAPLSCASWPPMRKHGAFSQCKRHYALVFGAVPHQGLAFNRMGRHTLSARWSSTYGCNLRHRGATSMVVAGDSGPKGRHV